MDIKKNTEYEIIDGPHVGKKAIIRGTEKEVWEIDNILQNIDNPAILQYLSDIANQIEDEYGDDILSFLQGDDISQDDISQVAKILKKHNYDGTVYYGKIVGGLGACFHHSWLQKIESGENNE